MKSNSHKIELLLAEKEITKSQLAEKCGLCRQNISTILTRKTCEPKTIGKISKGLNVSIDEIIEKE